MPLANGLEPDVHHGACATGAALRKRRLLIVVIGFLVILAIVGRLHRLDLPIDRDSFDEGVYWQTLRAMRDGHGLYRDIFHAQPPGFLLSAYPWFDWAGGTLWGARLGIAAVSLIGLLGACLLGRSLAGGAGAVAALLLLVVDPLYHRQSQILQADAPAAALALLAIGLAFTWRQESHGNKGMILALLTGAAFALSLLCKLLTIAVAAPLLWLLFAPLVRPRADSADRRKAVQALAAGLLGCGVATALVLWPFRDCWDDVLRGVVYFHTDAAQVYAGERHGSFHALGLGLLSPLTLTALYGALRAWRRRDARLAPLALWLAATLLFLARHVPLFQHHLIVLSAPLIALTVLGLPVRPEQASAAPMPARRDPIWRAIVTAAAIHAVVTGCASVWQNQPPRPGSRADLHARAAQDLKAAIQPDDLVITDAQFAAGLANRAIPAAVVDCSKVRIGSGYLSAHELIDAAADSRVRAVLILTNRLSTAKLAPFHRWIAGNFTLTRTYEPGQELWVR